MAKIPEVEAFLDGTNLGSEDPYRQHPTCHRLEPSFRFIIDGTDAEFDEKTQSYVHKTTGLTAARFYNANVALRYRPEGSEKVDDLSTIVHNCLVLVKDPDYFQRRGQSEAYARIGVGEVNGIVLIDEYVYALRLPHESDFNGLIVTRPVGRAIHNFSREIYDVGYDYQLMLGLAMKYYSQKIEVNRLEQFDVKKVKIPKSTQPINDSIVYLEIKN